MANNFFALSRDALLVALVPAMRAETHDSGSNTDAVQISQIFALASFS
jgi:hypothetical protein